ncbi:hypothetical protein EAO76_02925 [Streptomyces sp. sk2.1]|nr:hypothetical protein EAO76_02925 [Streptomyces sp. sk2.1]
MIEAVQGVGDPAAGRKTGKDIVDLTDSPVTGPVTSPYQNKNLVIQDRRIARMTIPPRACVMS